MMNRFEWLQAKSAQEAAKAATCTAAQLTVPGKVSASIESSVIKAGGIDLLDLMKEGLLNTKRVVNIRTLAGLDSISSEPGKGLTIGPLVTLTAIENHKEIRSRYAALAEAASHIATPNIRNAATLGGNLLQRPRCWYFRSADFQCLKKGGSQCFALDGENKFHGIFDNEKCPIVHASTMAIALVALGATIDILLADGKTKNVKLESFFVGPSADVQRENLLGANELVTAIRVPDNELQSAHIKLGEKDSFDWSIADCAVALEMKGDTCKIANIIIGAVAPIPWRAKEAEAMLADKRLSQDLAHEAGSISVKHAKPLSQNAYKLELVRAAVARAILKAADHKTV